MALVTVRRGSDLGGLLRRLKVELDGVVVARLRQRASVDLHVAPGRHTARARLDWLSSEPVDIVIAQGDHIFLEAAAGEHAQTFEATFRRPRSSLELTTVTRRGT